MVTGMVHLLPQRAEVCRNFKTVRVVHFLRGLGRENLGPDVLKKDFWLAGSRPR